MNFLPSILFFFIITLSSCSIIPPSPDDNIRSDLQMTLASNALLSSLASRCRPSPPPFTGEFIERMSFRLLSAQGKSFDSKRPIRVVLLDCDEPFSITLPPKTVALSTGMIQKMPSEAALAFLLGHEFSHLELQHLETSLEGEHHYRREQEEAADENALLMVLAAHYHPFAALDALNNPASRAALHHPSHPDTTDRYTKLRQALERTPWTGPGTISSRGFLKVQQTLRNRG